VPHKYPLLSAKEVAKALSKLGFSQVSQRGSHAKYSNGERVVIIPMHKEVKRAVLRQILLQAGVDLETFLG
jgi:predicted RNA binding protein YcfA (HicA-like mRNA interferase family)